MSAMTDPLAISVGKSACKLLQQLGEDNLASELRFAINHLAVRIGQMPPRVSPEQWKALGAAEERSRCLAEKAELRGVLEGDHE